MVYKIKFIYICNTKKNKVEIPSKLIKKWEVLRSPEDAAIVAVLAGCTPQSVRDAFKKKKCSDDLFKALAERYEQKAKTIKKYI